MKKVSTVAARQRKTFSQSTPTIGLDLWDRNSWYCILDETGYIQVEQRVRSPLLDLDHVFGGRCLDLVHSRHHFPGKFI
jgi:hypothetical protein